MEAFHVHARKYVERDGAAVVRQIGDLHLQDTLAVADQLPSPKIPARLAWGEAGRFQKIRCGERLSRDLGAPLRRIQGAKHFTPEDHPEMAEDRPEVIAEEITALE